MPIALALYYFDIPASRSNAFLVANATSNPDAADKVKLYIKDADIYPHLPASHVILAAYTTDLRLYIKDAELDAASRSHVHYYLSQQAAVFQSWTILLISVLCLSVVLHSFHVFISG